MNKHSLTALAGVVMLGSIIALWLRVHSLDQAIQALNKRLAAGPPVAIVPITQPQSANKAKKEPVFKLIEGAKHNERTSNVGVPWEVERAMIIEGAPNPNSPMPSETTIRVSPATPFLLGPSNDIEGGAHAPAGENLQ